MTDFSEAELSTRSRMRKQLARMPHVPGQAAKTLSQLWENVADVGYGYFPAKRTVPTFEVHVQRVHPFHTLHLSCKESVITGAGMRQLVPTIVYTLTRLDEDSPWYVTFYAQHGSYMYLYDTECPDELGSDAARAPAVVRGFGKFLRDMKLGHGPFHA
jgi:hypothetical protein